MRYNNANSLYYERKVRQPSYSLWTENTAIENMAIETPKGKETEQAATHICIFTVLTTCVNHSKCSTACSQLKYLVEYATLYYNK